MCQGIELIGQRTELASKWSHWIRQSHRWLSMVFTLTVVANFVVRARGEPPAWVTYSPLLPLFLLLFSGLYMFALPYVRRWRSTAGNRTVDPALD